MEYGEILSTVGGGSGIAAVLVVAIPRLLDAVRSARRDDAKGTELAAELVRERADEHRECREEVAELRTTIADCQRKHAETDARAAATETMLADLRGVVVWMQTQIEQLRRDSQRATQEPAE
jgi:hypothetical protein